MQNARVTLLFKNLPDKYPRALERDFPHILNRLMQIWELPEFDAYIHDLLIDTRGGRQGFPHAVIAELMFLSELRDILKRKGYHLPEEDPWKAVPLENPSAEGFFQAIKQGQLDVLNVYLTSGVMVDYRFENNQTPLITAAINGQLNVIRFLIGDGAKINFRDQGNYSALHWAAYYGHNRVIEALIRAGAEVNAIQNSGDTPLGLAVMRNHLKAAKLLLEQGADPNIAGSQGSPLAIAQSKNHEELIALLKRPVMHGK